MRFGPAGNEDSFYAQGYKNTWQAMAWLREMGLDAYEYPFGRGVRLSAESAAQIRAEAEGNGITVSAHAPYYINLTNPDPEKKEASFRYLLDGLTALRALGGREMVVHIGSQMKMQRDEALKMCREHLKEALRRLDDAGFADMTLCPETMGKKGQIGDLEETLDFCLLDERLTPCIDFAHLHALGGGCLRGTEDFARVLDRAEQVLVALTDNAIKYGDSGTLRFSAEKKGDSLYISVSNPGSIADEDIDHVFERFYKADKSHAGQGTGLGLSIVNEVLELLGERIWVKSENGTVTFTFTLSTVRPDKI